jgi:hypothetical protein
LSRSPGDARENLSRGQLDDTRGVEVEWFAVLPTELQAMLVLLLGAPYLAMVSGVLVTYRQVRDEKAHTAQVMQLLSRREDIQERSVAAMEKGAEAVESTRIVMEELLGAAKKGEGRT